MIRTLIFSGILIIVFFSAKYLGLDYLLHPKKWLILGFFVAFSSLFHRLIEIGFRDNREKFIPFYISTVVLRLILSVAFIFIEIYLGLLQQRLFILNFFVLYLFYTSFEIWNLSRKLRHNSEK